MQANTWNNNLVKELDCDLKHTLFNYSPEKFFDSTIDMTLRGKVRAKMAVNKHLLRKQRLGLVRFMYCNQGYQHCVSKKSGNFTKCLTYALPQAIGLPRHRRG